MTELIIKILMYSKEPRQKRGQKLSSVCQVCHHWYIVSGSQCTHCLPWAQSVLTIVLGVLDYQQRCTLPYSAVRCTVWYKMQTNAHCQVSHRGLPIVETPLSFIHLLTLPQWDIFISWICQLIHEDIISYLYFVLSKYAEKTSIWNYDWICIFVSKSAIYFHQNPQAHNPISVLLIIFLILSFLLVFLLQHLISKASLLFFSHEGSV